jgi:hypothetical protein
MASLENKLTLAINFNSQTEKSVSDLSAKIQALELNLEIIKGPIKKSSLELSNDIAKIADYGPKEVK